MSLQDLSTANLDASVLTGIVADQDRPLVFATVSGAHLYGFPSKDSDVDLRGVHLLATSELAGLRYGPETVERMWEHEGTELDLVTHDIAKFARLLLRPNGYVAEQLLSPLVVHSTEAHQELIALAPGFLTSRHAHHYRGFAKTQWRLFERNGELKPLLYTFRALLTGVHLLRTGQVLAHLPSLIEAQGGPGYLPELITAKVEGEHRPLDSVSGAPDAETLAADLLSWLEWLDVAENGSALPLEPSVHEEMHQLVLRLRP
ncbi:nucleotidyltransferase domain-containing protein [Crossiella cryophila]|uniref:Putative nucleotidyltransferase n=1 Tax=Crossiella cryophila TaxID=43355 RepID=A0A7W7C3Z4_9PSEU|nr:nucleotidyltransferase domain-containing protein [Crossiella cryophila]MBB4674110.1 putative nucleotidyltransferase [Crossiella cryophila]